MTGSFNLHVDSARHRLRRLTVCVALLLALPSQGATAAPSLRADPVAELEARILYSAAEQSMASGAYDRALERWRSLMHHYDGSKYAVEAGERISAIRRVHEPPREISSAARVGLVSFGTLYVTGLGVGTGILVESAELIFGIGLMAGPTLGIVTSLRRTRGARLSDGQASLLALGGAWGAWQGIGTAVLVNGGEKTVTGAGMIGSSAGLLASRVLVGHTYVTTAEATLISFAGIWGTWFALSGVKTMGESGSDPALTSALIGGNVGLITAGWYAPSLRLSANRVRLINLGGIVGTLYGLGAAVLADVNHRTRPTFAFMLAGGLGGLAAGAYLTRDYDPSRDPLAMVAPGAAVSIRRDRLIWGLPIPTVRPSPHPRPREIGRDVDLGVDLVRLAF